MEKALIAMSGGVDSSVAAALMQERGYDCIGITMKLYDSETGQACRSRTCCTLEDVEDARQVGLYPFHALLCFEFQGRFSEESHSSLCGDL